jgi:N-acetylglucosamine kinase-like BadF-type ATPase
MDYVIGIDGGGTKTLACLAALDAKSPTEILGRGRAGPGNPRSAGFDVACANIDAAIEAAFANACIPRDTVRSACFCLAGAGRELEQERIRRWVESRGIAQRVRVTGDAEPVLAAASPENCGIALISGTGSLAWGRNRQGEIARAGGWGHLLGDEGSGYAIAIAALRAAVRADDGRGPPTQLLPRLLARLQIVSPAELIEAVYRPDRMRDELAALSGVVFEAAEQDEMAKTIIFGAADELAQMVTTLCNRLALAPHAYPLALTGGVLLTQPLLRERLLQRLDDRRAKPDTVHLVEEPVLGAVALAQKDS